jgi:hypothetical protein
MMSGYAIIHQRDITGRGTVVMVEDLLAVSLARSPLTYHSVPLAKTTAVIHSMYCY